MTENVGTATVNIALGTYHLMLDKSKVRPRLDLQQHLADLEAAGLLVRIDRPINKDTELNPLVRWQFIGGVPERSGALFLFTNVIDSKGRRYDMPVVVGALASSPAIYGRRHAPAMSGIESRRGINDQPANGQAAGCTSRAPEYSGGAT